MGVEYFMLTTNNYEFSPMVGIVVTISPNFSLYRIVVLPAASNPTISILISFLPNSPLNKFANTFPMLLVLFYLSLSFSGGLEGVSPQQLIHKLIKNPNLRRTEFGGCSCLSFCIVGYVGLSSVVEGYFRLLKF